MPQARTEPRPDRRRRALTEKERAEVIARIIDIILTDPGEAPSLSSNERSEPDRGGSLPPAPTPLVGML